MKIKELIQQKTSWFSLAFVGFVGLIGILGTSRSPLCACLGPEGQGRGSVRTLNRSQQGYWMTHQSFAPTIEALAVGINSESQYYQYSTVATPTKVLSYGIPREPGYSYVQEVYGFGLYSRKVKDKQLPSYVGAVFAIKSGTVEILCQAREPGLALPNSPKLQEEKAICGEGTIEVN